MLSRSNPLNLWTRFYWTGLVQVNSVPWQNEKSTVRTSVSVVLVRAGINQYKVFLLDFFLSFVNVEHSFHSNGEKDLRAKKVSATLTTF